MYVSGFNWTIADEVDFWKLTYAFCAFHYLSVHKTLTKSSFLHYTNTMILI